MSRAGTNPGRTASSWLIAWAIAFALLFLIAPYYPRKPDPFEAIIDRTGASQRRLEHGESTEPKFLRDGKPRIEYVGEFSEGLAVVTDAPGDSYWKDSTLETRSRRAEEIDDNQRAM